MSERAPEPEGDLLLAFLRDRDVPCPRCGYNLRNLLGHRCPECGDELTLRVNLSEPKLAAFLTGLIGLTAGAGFNGLLILYAVIMTLTPPPGEMDRSIWPMTIIGFVVLGGCGVFWLVWRTLIRRQSPKRQWILAILCWSLTIADLLIFTKSIR